MRDKKLIPREASAILKNLLDKGKVVVVLGARQVGKSTLVEETLNAERVKILNFDSPHDEATFEAMSLMNPTDAMRFLGSPDVLIVDEAQRLPKAARIIKGWYDAKLPVKFVMLGSSSLNLLSQSAESLTGRNYKLQLPPLLLTEALCNESWWGDGLTLKIAESAFAPQLRQAILTRMIYGLYPEVTANQADAEKLLRTIADDYLYKDVIQAGAIKTTGLIRRLLMMLAHQIGSEVSTSEIAQSLGISRITVDRYLDLLEQTFVIFRLPAFSRNPRKEITRNHKIFFWDTGIRNALLNAFDVNDQRPDIGHLFENFVISEVKKRAVLFDATEAIHFWRHKATQSEVDLVVVNGECVTPYEIKWNDRVYGRSITFRNEYGMDVKTLHPSKPSAWPCAQSECL